MGSNGPTFGKAPSSTTEVQFRYVPSPNAKSISIPFDDFSVKILPSGPPIATRSLSIGFPLLDIVSESAMAIDVRGFARFEGGTNGTIVFRVLGETHVIDPLKSPCDKDPSTYLSSFKVKVPAKSEDLRVTFFIAVEQGASKQFGEALLTVDSIEGSIA
jgi:hypothetical protein